MNTNFFNQIQQLDFTGVLQLNISKGIESNLIVTVLLNNEQCGDSAKNLIPPLTFNATPQEFDEGFFEQITTPIQKSSGLMVNMEAFMKQLELAKQQSAMEKQKSEREKKAKEEKDKKYKEAMAKVDELEKQGRYRDAWIKVPEPTLYPQHQEAIQKRRASLALKFAPDLFATSEVSHEQPLEETQGLFPENPTIEEGDEIQWDEDNETED